MRDAGLLILHQLENLLRVTALECGGKPVQVDSFRFADGVGGLRARQATPARQPRPAPERGWARCDPLLAYAHVEPRLVIARNLFARLQRCVRLMRNGTQVDVDGFRLTNLGYWARYACMSLADNLTFGSLSPACSCHCEFCFVKGWGASPLVRHTLTMQEAATRAKYYAKDTRRGLPAVRSWPGEPFLNPRVLDFLRMCREAEPETLLCVTTNGDFLTEPVVRELARLKPIELAVSLNSSNPDTRRRVMRSRCPHVAVEAIPLLEAYRIQFIGSVVPAPSITLDDVAETARFLDRHSALMIRFPLPGYTRFQPPPPPGALSRWDDVVELARALRGEMTTPIHLQPALYDDHELAPRIGGIYRNSPAERAGLRAGDVITSVAGRPVFTKMDVLDAFALEPRGPDAASCPVGFERDGTARVADLADPGSVDDDWYPFKPRGHAAGQGGPDALCRGIHITQGFRLESLRSLKACIDRFPAARKVLLFTTPLVKNHFLQGLALAGSIPECQLDRVELRVTVAPHRYWQGNIMIGDLHVVQDYIDHIRELMRFGYRPDLAVVPGSFVSPWRLDVAGNSFTEIERQTGVPAELIPAERITW